MAAQDDAQAGSWLTLSEAAERSGLHKEALRAKAKRGQLEARRNNRGETLVMLPPSLLRAAQGDGKARAEQLIELIRGLEDELAAARTELAKAAGRVETARSVAVADVATAKAEVQAKDEVIAELRRELEWHRRPWWRRLVG